MFTKDCIVFDHAERKLYIFSSPFLTYESDLESEYNKSCSKILALRNYIAILGSDNRERIPQNEDPDKKTGEYFSSVSKEKFEESVRRIKEHIAAGDIFQAVLSRRIECAVNNDPFLIYAAIRDINPSPYMYYLDFGDEQVIGASPEMLVRVEKRQVTTVPIAGTRPRGQDSGKDAAFARELLADPKERAEHTMLVDLARNDIWDGYAGSGRWKLKNSWVSKNFPMCSILCRQSVARSRITLTVMMHSNPAFLQAPYQVHQK